jgi:HSP20 family molecular chaperone IbpA
MFPLSSAAPLALNSYLEPGLREEDSLDEPLQDTLGSVLPSLQSSPARVSPEVREDSDAFTATLAAPGENDRTVSVRQAGSNAVHVRAGSTLNRKVHFPASADLSSDSVTARCVDGLLTISVPKKASTISGPVDLPVNSSLPEHTDLSVNMPGFAPSEVQVTIEPDELTDRFVLHVRGQSRRGGRINRSYTVPTDAEISHAEAGVQDGILGIRLPRQQQQRLRLQQDQDQQSQPREHHRDRRRARGGESRRSGGGLSGLKRLGQRGSAAEQDTMEMQAAGGRGHEIAAKVGEPKGRTLIQEHLPDVQPSSVHAEVEGNNLVVTGEQSSSSGGVQSYRSFSRAVTLPRGVRSENIDVYCNDGTVVAVAKDGTRNGAPEPMQG